jgi:GcrA cell cycle regulator
MKESFWNEERIERLRELWGRDWSASDIAADIGCTRNAVIGKKMRLKLGMRASVIVSEQERAKKVFERKMARNARSRAKYTVAKQTGALKPRKPVLLEVKPMVESLKIGLRDIKLDECHWPTNDDMQNVEFCGHPVSPLQGRPHYCAHHQWVSSPRSEIRCDAPEPGKKNWTPMGGLMVA